ncbi:uncharacterized protein A4U43_C10F2310 [Asparagus officinalis]|uniref:ARID domain-containing protein n=1 Tax=Asparagus officinalis TaxID=4686 RepID=A0A5P1E006_ASPOF|nr:uncharacterized protein A4U43_C10F2310 [Asparagus officinalis]
MHGILIYIVVSRHWMVFSIFSSRERHPLIGGEKLDLFLLYFLVTQRGGIEKAIVDNKWREVYFFRRQGPVVAPSGNQPGSDHGPQIVDNSRLVIAEVAPLPENEERNRITGSGSNPHASLDNDNETAAYADVPSEPNLGLHAPSGDASPIRENEPVEAESPPANRDAHGSGENMPAGPQNLPEMLQQVQTLSGANIPASSFTSSSDPGALPTPCIFKKHGLCSLKKRKGCILTEKVWRRKGTKRSWKHMRRGLDLCNHSKLQGIVQLSGRTTDD